MAVKCILTGQTPSVLDGVTENVQTQINAKAADSAVVHLAEDETISGAKTFTGKVVMNSSDNVGIGTTAPSEKLEVTGNIKATKFKGDGSELTNIPYPVTKVAGKTGAVTLAKGDVGLGNVDNTSDANKPISNATQAALNGKQAKITANGLLKGDGAGGVTTATKGTDYAATPKILSITLSASSWDSTALTQTVTANGVLSDETAQSITPTPALASQLAYYDAGILCTGQAENSLTFTCETVPTIDLTVYVVIQEVRT